MISAVSFDVGEVRFKLLPAMLNVEWRLSSIFVRIRTDFGYNVVMHARVPKA